MSSSQTQPKKIIILGALSAIAEAAARLWAEPPCAFVLVGRNAQALEAVAADLRTRGAQVSTLVKDLDVAQPDSELPSMAQQLGGRVDVILLAYGSLGEHTLAESDMHEAHRIITNNFASAAVWCLAAASLLEKEKHGVLVVVGSVAGDRGRASNYIYGAAKGGLGILVQGIAHRLAKSGARAVLVKPGFVDTPMTAHIARKGLLWAKPDSIANTIVEVSRPGSGSPPIVYAPKFWRAIMTIIRVTPSFIFHRTRL